MKSQVLHTVWCYFSGEAAGEFVIDHSWEWKGQSAAILFVLPKILFGLCLSTCFFKCLFAFHWFMAVCLFFRCLCSCVTSSNVRYFFFISELFPCENYSPICHYYGKTAQCRDVWMQRHCRKFCGLCDGKSGELQKRWLLLLLLLFVIIIIILTTAMTTTTVMLMMTIVTTMIAVVVMVMTMRISVIIDHRF